MPDKTTRRIVELRGKIPLRDNHEKAKKLTLLESVRLLVFIYFLKNRIHDSSLNTGFHGKGDDLRDLTSQRSFPIYKFKSQNNRSPSNFDYNLIIDLLGRAGRGRGLGRGRGRGIGPVKPRKNN